MHTYVNYCEQKEVFCTADEKQGLASPENAVESCGAPVQRVGCVDISEQRDVADIQDHQQGCWRGLM